MTVLNQVVFCSQRSTPRRIWQRELIISDTQVLVMPGERLPPGYEFAIERMRDLNEQIARIPAGRIRYASGDTGCPYCGLSHCFYCDCGAVSCLAPNARIHICPRCGHIADNLVDVDTIAASPSGMVPGRPPPSSVPHEKPAPITVTPAVQAFLDHCKSKGTPSKPKLPSPGSLLRLTKK